MEANMERVVASSLAVLLVCLVLAGCEPDALVAGNKGPPVPPAPPAHPGVEQAPIEPAPPALETERVKAEKGVGNKGRSLDEYEGPVVTPAKTLFTAKERIAF